MHLTYILLSFLQIILNIHSTVGTNNYTLLEDGPSLSNDTQDLNITSILNDDEMQELKYYPDEGRGADGYISSFFESFWPFRTHKSNAPSFTPSPLLEISGLKARKEEFILKFCQGKFKGDLEDLKKTLSEFGIPFNSDLYVLQSQLCLDSFDQSEFPTSKRPYYDTKNIITKQPQQEFVVQSGFSFDSSSGEKRDYYPSDTSPVIRSRSDEVERPYFISSDRRSDSDRSLNNHRYRRINLNRQSPPKPAIMNDNDVKFYPATVQDFLDAPGRPFIKKLPTLELRQKASSPSFPHFPRRVAPEQKITPRFPAKTPATTTPRTTTVTVRSLSKFVAYEANPDAHRKRVVIKPRKHIVNHHGTRRSRVRIPVRKNPYEAQKEKQSVKNNRGVINVSTIINHKPKSSRPFIDPELPVSIQQFGTVQKSLSNSYANSDFIRNTPSIITSSTSEYSSTSSSTTMSTTTTTTTTSATTSTTSFYIRVQPSVFDHSNVIQEISAPTSFVIPEEFASSFGAKQVVESEPFLPEEALLLQNDLFDSLITTERNSDYEETTLNENIEDLRENGSTTTIRVISAEDFQFLPSSVLPSIEFRPEDNESQYYDDIETVIGDLNDVASPSPVEDLKPKSKGSAQKLAYILIGICCGLSILCLVVVVVSLGYKSERNFMSEEYRRNLFRRIMSGYLSNGRTRFSSGSSNSSIHEKTSTSKLTGATNSGDVAPEDQPSHKLGSWFNGKLHNIQTLDRKKKEKVFPTNVYLDNLNDLTRISDNESKKIQKVEIENEEDDAFSVEELFESRSKVVSNASSSSPTNSVRSIDKSVKGKTATVEIASHLTEGQNNILTSSPSPPPLQEDPAEEPSTTTTKEKDDNDEIVLSDNNDRLI